MRATTSKDESSPRICTKDAAQEEIIRILNCLDRGCKKREELAASLRKKTLYEFFKPEKSPGETAIIYDDPKSIVRMMTYEEVNYVAEKVEKKLAGLITSGIVVVSLSEKKLLQPSVQIGVMKSGCGFYSVYGLGWEKRMESAVKILNVRLVILDEMQFASHSKWILDHAVGQEFIEVILRGESEVLRLIRIVEPGPDPDIKPMAILKPFEFAYAIQTSGSTAIKKFVLVPHSCIIPNVEDFIGPVWKMNSKDVVFGCSPWTFDPSIIELFSAFGCSGKILYVPEDVKLDGIQLGKLLLKHQITVLQTTPSLLRRVGKNLKDAGVFTPGITHLEVLAIGGERCLFKEELRELLSSEMVSRLRCLMNLYGVTEVSCWASFAEIDPYNLEPIRISKAYLEGFSETRVSTDFDDNLVGTRNLTEILIRSETRKCTVLRITGEIITNRDIEAGRPRRNKDWTNHQVNTGDFGCQWELGISYVGRLDRIVKKNGMKIPLYTIEEMAMQSSTLTSAECVVWKEKIHLVVAMKEKCASLIGLGRNMRAKLIPELFLDIVPEFYPETIIGVHSIPLNDNGKIDMKNILKYVEAQKCYRPGDYFLRENTIVQTLTPLWIHITGYGEKSRGTRRELDVLKQNFYAAGGDSVAAAWFTESAFQLLKLSGTELQETLEPILFRRLSVATFASICRLLMDAILDSPLAAKVGLVSAEEIIDFKLNSGRRRIDSKDKTDSGCPATGCEQAHGTICSSSTISREPDGLTSPLRSLFSSEIGLRMCVDARASVAVKGHYEGVAVIGSHSGHLVAVDLVLLRLLIENKDRDAISHGGVMWTTILPGRVEGQIEFNEEGSFAFIGCHDKRLYKVSTIDGSISSDFLCNGALRSKPSLGFGSGYLAIIDENNYLYCLRDTVSPKSIRTPIKKLCEDFLSSIVFTGFTTSSKHTFCDTTKCLLVLMNSNTKYYILLIHQDLKLIWKKRIIAGILSTSAPACSSEYVVVTTLKSGLMAFAADDGTLAWPTDGVFVDSSTSPVIIRIGEAEQVVFATRKGAEGRACDTGNILWIFHEPSVWGDLAPFTPQVHMCTYEPVTELLITSRYGKMICVDLQGNKISEAISGNTKICGTVLCTRNSNNKNIYCYALSKPSTEDNFTLSGLKDGHNKVLDICTRMNYDIFSVPCTYNEFLLFGGRDNNVHAIKFNSSSSKDYPYIRVQKYGK